MNSGKGKAMAFVYDIVKKTSPVEIFFSTQTVGGDEISGLMSYLAQRNAVRLVKTIVKSESLVVENEKEGVIQTDLEKARDELKADIISKLSSVGYELEITKPTTRVVDINGRQSAILVLARKKGLPTAEDMLHEFGYSPKIEGTSKTGSLCKYFNQPGTPTLVVNVKYKDEKGFGDGQAYMHEDSAIMFIKTLTASYQAATTPKLLTMIERTIEGLSRRTKKIIKGFVADKKMFGKGNIKLLSDEDWKAMFGDQPAFVNGLPVLMADANWIKVYQGTNEYEEAVFFLHDTRGGEYKKRVVKQSFVERTLVLDELAEEEVMKNFNRIVEKTEEEGLVRFLDTNEFEDMKDNAGFYTPAEAAKVAQSLSESVMGEIFSVKTKALYLTIEPALPHWNVKKDEIVLNPVWRKFYKEGLWAPGYRAPVLGPQAIFWGKIRFDSRVAPNGVVFGNDEEYLVRNLAADFDGDGVFVIAPLSKVGKALYKGYYDKKAKRPVPVDLEKEATELVDADGTFESREEAIVNAIVAQRATGLGDNHLSALYASAFRTISDGNKLNKVKDIIDAIWEGLEITQGLVKMIKKPGAVPKWNLLALRRAWKITRAKYVFISPDNPTEYVLDGTPGPLPQIEKVAGSLAPYLVRWFATNEVPAMKLEKREGYKGTNADLRLVEELYTIFNEEAKELLKTNAGYEQGMIFKAAAEKSAKKVAASLIKWKSLMITEDQPFTLHRLVWGINGAAQSGKSKCTKWQYDKKAEKYVPVTAPAEDVTKKAYAMLNRVLPGFKVFGPLKVFSADLASWLTPSVIDKKRMSVVAEVERTYYLLMLGEKSEWTGATKGKKWTLSYDPAANKISAVISIFDGSKWNNQEIEAPLKDNDGRLGFANVIDAIFRIKGGAK